MDELYYNFCMTDRQKEVLIEYLADGTAGAAETLDVSRRTIRKSLARIRANAEKQGYSPEKGYNHIPVEGQTLIGVSKYDKNDRTWYRYKADKDEQEALFVKTIENVMSEYDGIAPTLEPPSSIDFTNLLTTYVLADPHVSMLSWKEETGLDYDSDIAVEAIRKSVKSLTSCTHKTKRALLVLLGDLLHYDGIFPETTWHKNTVDCDSRWPKMLEVAISALYDTVMLIAQKHKAVDVLVVGGNHDTRSAMTIAIGMKYFFSKNVNINIIYSPNPFNYYEYGENLLGVHHGDRIKPAQFGPIMAQYDNGRPWGRTTHRHWLLGHTHQKAVTELHGCVVESFRAVAPNEAYANAAGYRSKTGMEALTYQKHDGLIQRNLVDPMSLVSGGV